METDAVAEADERAATAYRRRWLSLTVVVMAAVIIVIDTSVLNVSIPTLILDLDTDIATVQWAITGYALTFATFLIVGGRLGDMFGHRRMFVFGAGLFAIGSVIASVAPSIGVLIVGEAVIEGVGAALMLPATTAILSRTFVGRERVKAFATWGTTVGAASAFGPIIGGYLTTYHSWRWGFRINVIIAVLAIIGAFAFMYDRPSDSTRPRLDWLGAVLVAVAAFLMVFGISVMGERDWALSALSLTVAVIAIAGFVVVERHQERAGGDPIVAFGDFREPTFRVGVMATSLQLAAQGAVMFVLPILLQEVRGLSAFDSGLSVVPIGICVVIGAQLSPRVARRRGVAGVVRIGLAVATLGAVLISVASVFSLTFGALLPGFVVYGLGFGLATSQLSNLVLGSVRPDRAGVASGTNSTGRQIGAAVGVAVSATLLSAGALERLGPITLGVAALALGAGARLAWRLTDVRNRAHAEPFDPAVDEAIEAV